MLVTEVNLRLLNAAVSQEGLTHYIINFVFDLVLKYVGNHLHRLLDELVGHLATALANPTFFLLAVVSS